MKKFRFQPFKGDKEKEHRVDPESIDGAMNTDDSGNSEEAGNIEEAGKDEDSENTETTEDTGNSDGTEDSDEIEGSDSPEEIQVTENSGMSEGAEETGESDKPEGQRIADLLEEIDRLKKEVVTARAEGEIAGRNARIEELIMTDAGDGLPGMSPATLSASRADSIFSLAAGAR